MQQHRILAILALAALLSACGRESTTISETIATTDTEITTDTVSPTTTARETTASTQGTTTATTPRREIGMDIPKDIHYEYDEENGNKYALYNFIPIAIHSDAEEVAVQPLGKTIHFRDGNLFAGILQQEISQLPNCRVLSFDEGIQTVWLYDNFLNAPKLEILRFPTSMNSLLTNPKDNRIPESEELPAEVYVPYDPNRRGSDAYFSFTMREQYGSAASFENAQKSALCHGTFLTWQMLTRIEIAEGNTHYYDDNGVLYIKDGEDLRNDHILYHPDLTELPQNGMKCLPQSYQTSDGTYTVRDGTEAIFSGAVYHPKFVEQLILPDSLLYISPTAIIATPEHPLTVVCSRSSTAAVYVEKFGTQYHLTVEYTD